MSDIRCTHGVRVDCSCEACDQAVALRGDRVVNAHTVELMTAEREIGCFDSACPFTRHLGGMRTNSGCRCIDEGLPISWTLGRQIKLALQRAYSRGLVDCEKRAGSR